MFANIVIPVDLEHRDKLDKAIRIGADLARLYQARATLVGITPSTPTEAAHNPEEFDAVLRQLATERSEALGYEFQTLSRTTPDPAADLEKVLNELIHELGGDLVIMGSHVPGFRDHLIRSHSSALAAHTDVSVLIVR